MAFYGIKRPLNQIENPIYPDIRKAPPRFENAGKYWKVDMGSVVRNMEMFSDMNMAAGGIVAQDRDYNKQMFGGASSHREKIVNFRPPLTNYYDDVCPQHMVPATTRIIATHLNPTTVVDGGVSAFLADNFHTVDTDRYIIKDKVACTPVATAGYNKRIDNRIDNSVLPDLELKLPQVASSAGYDPVYRDPTNHVIDVQIDYSKPDLPLEAGNNYSGVYTTTGPSTVLGFENFEFTDNRPQVFADSGANYQYRDFNVDTELPDLKHTIPQVSTSAGKEYNYRPSNLEETQIPDLEHNIPQVSASAGYNPTYRPPDIQETHIELEYTIPQVAASAGYQTPYISHDVDSNKNIVQRQVTEQTKAYTPLTSTANYQYREINHNDIDPSKYLHTRHEVAGVSGHQPKYTDTGNALRRQMTYREKLQPIQPIGLSQTTAIRPHMGIGLPSDYGTVIGLKPESKYRPVEYNYSF